MPPKKRAKISPKQNTAQIDVEVEGDMGGGGDDASRSSDENEQVVQQGKKKVRAIPLLLAPPGRPIQNENQG